MRSFRTLLLLLMVGSSACTTIQEVDKTKGSLAAHLDMGDHIVVYTATGTIIDMRYVLIEDDVMRGSVYGDGLRSVAVELGQIEKVEVIRGAPDDSGDRLSNAAYTMEVIVLMGAVISLAH